MLAFLWAMRPYLRQVAGQLALGSAAGIIMNTAVVLPAILLGRAIDRALALERGEATAGEVGWAALAFIGGTLQRFGGHNPIEAAAAGVPVCFGPSMTNFREIAEVFLHAEAAQQVETAADVIAFARHMFDDEDARKAMGSRARRTVQQNRGASERTARRIVELLA